MTRQNQAAEAKSDERKRLQAKPSAPAGLTGELTWPAELPAGPVAAGGGSIQAQAACLGDPRLLTVQRQMLASRIERLQGNQHLQRVVTSLEPSLVQRDVVSVPEEEAIRVGRPSGREVPPRHDWTVATIERAFHSTVPNQSNDFLISMAVGRNERLLHPPTPMGPRTQSAIAETLIMIYDELDRRIAAAPLGADGLPVVEGLSWEADDPLAGTLEAIAPLGLYDVWQTFVRELPFPEPELPTPEPPPRPHRRPQDPVATISWRHAPPSAREPVSPYEPVRIGSHVTLDGSGSQDPSGGPLTYHWELQPETGGPIDNPDAMMAHFRPRWGGTYIVTLTVRNRQGRDDRDQQRIPVEGRRPPRPLEPGQGLRRRLDLRDLQRNLRDWASPGSFARWYLHNVAPLYAPAPNPLDPHQLRTFQQSGPEENAQLERILDENRTFTTSDSRYLQRMRGRLQRTVDAWGDFFTPEAGRGLQGEDRWNFQRTDEWINFCHFIEGTTPPGNRNIPEIHNIGYMLGKGHIRPLR